jgi:ActR/RegA family two-component response regulator
MARRPDSPPSDVVLLGTEWRPRALLRAQLIEEGIEVLATDTWPVARRSLRPGVKPRLVVVDLQGLPDPDRVLSELRVLMKPDRVLVLTAIGTVPVDVIRAAGFHVMKRPASIDEVVAEIVRLVTLS